MKPIFFFIILLSVNYCFAQNNKAVSPYPLEISTAEYFARSFANAKDSVAPIGQIGSFQYLNIHTNTPIINYTFEEAYPFYRGYALIKVANKYGVIKRNGEYVVQPKFERFSLITGLGTNTTIAFDNMIFFDFDEGKLVKEVGGHMYEPVRGDIGYYEQSGKYGLIFKDGSRSKPIYDSVLIRIQHMMILRKAGKIGAVNCIEKTIAPFVFTDAVIQKWNGYTWNLSYALRHGDSWHYFDTGRELFESKYKPVSMYYKLSIVKTAEGFNYLDDSGKFLLPKSYKWVSALGYLAINDKDEIVLFDEQRHAYNYYIP